MESSMPGAPWWTSDSKKEISTDLKPRDPRSVGVAMLVVLLVGSLAFWGMTAISPDKTRPGVYGSTEHMTSISAVLNGCGNIYVFPVQEEFVGTYDPAEITPNSAGERPQPLLPTVVQPYGFMYNAGLPDDTPYYSPKDSKGVALGAVLRSMYDGKIIIWYKDGLIQEDTDVIRNFAWAHKDRVIAVATDMVLPQDRSVAFATWGVTMSCSLWEDSVVQEFIDFVDEHYDEIIPSVEPPRAKIKNGKFPSIALNPFG